MKPSTPSLLEYEAHTRDNELEIISSKDCGCINCGMTFSARKVHAWSHEGSGLSARCPYCGLTYVVGNASDLPISKRIFQNLLEQKRETMDIQSAREELLDFCQNYFEGKIDQSDIYDNAYETYLLTVYDAYHDAVSSLALARLYFRGLPSIERDFDAAIHYYGELALAGNAQAQYELGLVYDLRGKRGDHRNAFEAFSRSSALGSLPGAMMVADYYLHGKYVRANPEFAVAALLSVFAEMYAKLFSSMPMLPELGVCAAGLCGCFHEGYGCEKNEMSALRYALIVDYVTRLLDSPDYSASEMIQEAFNALREQRAEHMLGSNEITYDEDTFYDSFLENYDFLCEKTVTRVDFNEATGSLTLGIEFSNPVLIVDLGNVYAEATNRTEWLFEVRHLELHPTQRVFERFVFEGDNVVDFYHDDPNYGEMRVLHIEFAPPAPTKEEDDE